MKAKFIKSFISQDFNRIDKTLVYEYRGRQYLITIPIGRQTALGEDIASQHMMEQKRIDRMLDADNTPQIPVYENTAAYGLDMFMKYFDEPQ